MWFKIKKIVVVKTYANVEEMLVVAKDVERVLGELGEMLFEPLKEEQEEGTIAYTRLEKQESALNESRIKNFKGFSYGVRTTPQISSSSIVCQI